MHKHNTLGSYEELIQSDLESTRFIHIIPYHGKDDTGTYKEKLIFYDLSIEQDVYDETINKLENIMNFCENKQLTELEKYLYVKYKLTEVKYERGKINEELRNNIFGTFGKGKANCCGFASSENFIEHAIGLESYIVYTKDKESKKEHFYNITKIDGKYTKSDGALDQYLSEDETTSFKCIGKSAESLKNIQSENSWKYDIKKIYNINGDEPKEDIISQCREINIDDKMKALVNVLYLDGKTEEEIQEYLRNVDFGEKEPEIGYEYIDENELVS